VKRRVKHSGGVRRKSVGNENAPGYYVPKHKLCTVCSLEEQLCVVLIGEVF
jgi:hypothetical protein